MPLPIVSPMLFNAHALPADPADSHLQPGIHLRVDANPLLGLPVAPHIVWRAVLREGRQIKLHNDAVFVDSRGRVLIPPFTLAPDNPVTAHLAVMPGQTCIWSRVNAEADGSTPERPKPRRLDASRGLAAASSIVATAFVSTPLGPAVVARRTAAPYAFGAPGLVQIQLQGSGTVIDVVWLEQREVGHLDWQPFTLLNLPHPGGARYLPLVDAIDRAEARLLAQAPKRRPLQETLGLLSPAQAPLEVPQWEGKRVRSLTEPLEDDLDRLITDLSESPLTMRTTAAVTDARGRRLGTFTQRCLDRVLQSRFDPGSAALFGHKALDPAFAVPQPLLVFYWVAGFFQDLPPAKDAAPADPFIDALLARLDPQARLPSGDAWVSTWIKLASRLDVPLDRARLKQMRGLDNVIGVGALAVADRSASPAPMLPPTITAHRHVGWLSMPVPEARREVELQLADVGVAALLAAEKQTLNDGQPHDSLHATNDDGYHLPLLLGRNAGDESSVPAAEPGTGQLADRRASADRIRYGVAQQDSFGRWSDWATAVNSPGPRPRPPRPVFQAHYLQPENLADNTGAVRVIVEVPPLDSLAPASLPVADFELQVTDMSTQAVSTRHASIAVPMTPPAKLDFRFCGPPLAATEMRKLRLIARWRDDDGQFSEPAEPAVLTLHDPRPPTQIAVPDTLMYSGRPDITGLSSVEFTWTPTPDQANVAIWYSDENRIVADLGRSLADPDLPPDPDSVGLRQQLLASRDPVERATLIRDHHTLIRDGLFERLQGVVFDGPAGQKTFRHAVSGSLRILSVYRVAAESASGARLPLNALPLLTFAVPNADPPPRPVLEIRPVPMTDNGQDYAAEIRITLTKGLTTAAQWRLRRTLMSTRDPQRMPVVDVGPMASADDEGRQRAVHIDRGHVQISATARLRPWLSYTWVAEAQGDPAPGSMATNRPVPGAWGSPSDPVSLMLVPPQPPAAVTALAASGTAGNGGWNAVALTFTHPHGLAGGTLGAYRLRVMRRDPGRPLRILGVIELPAEGPYRVSGMDPAQPSDVALPGSVYRVVVIDPIGRESGAAETTLA